MVELQMCIRDRQKAGTNRVFLLVTSCKRLQFLFLQKENRPVSYTHLDVYKRQQSEVTHMTKTVSTSKKPRKQQSPEFRSEALKLAERIGVTAAARELSLYESCLLYTSRCV